MTTVFAAFVALVVVPFAGICVARLFGPLTLTRGLVGAVLLPVALSLGVPLLFAYARRSGSMQLYYPEESPHFHTVIRLGRPWVGFSLWIVDALVVGAAIVAVWRAVERHA
jgi:hypothetical protein